MKALDVAREALTRLRQAVEKAPVTARVEEIGRVQGTGDGIARVSGLPGVRDQELVAFPDGLLGIAFNLDPDEVGCVLLGDAAVSAGDTVRRTDQVVRTAVGRELIGRVVDPLGNPLDGGPDISPEGYLPVEREAPPILSRSPVVRPLATGIKSIDAMIPIGRGQRELIIGDRSTGKTTIAIDAIINQRKGDVICVYVAIGQRASSVARFIDALRTRGAMDYTIVVVADADASPGMRFVAPYAGCAMSEFFAEQGKDTLIVYDDLTKHAQTYREISLLLRRPPGREAYPGDIFFVHSRLLERATQYEEKYGGGSQTALPIVETQAQNVSAYIPTNLISITDGQIYLSPDLFQAGFLPAVDVGLSVSRVGGKTQIPAMKRLAQETRLAYTQFLELEQFTKFGTTLESQTREALEKGRRLRELLKQPAHDPAPLAEQVVILHAISEGIPTDVPLERIPEFEERLREFSRERLADLLARIESGQTVEEQDAAAIRKVAEDARDAAKSGADGPPNEGARETGPQEEESPQDSGPKP